MIGIIVCQQDNVKKEEINSISVINNNKKTTVVCVDVVVVSC